MVPVWQFKPSGGLIDGLVDVMRRIYEVIPRGGGLHPFTILLLENPLTAGDRPLDALRDGRVSEVLEVVEAQKY